MCPRSRDSHPVFQPPGATLPSLSANTMRIRPEVPRKAPSQSTRLVYVTMSRPERRIAPCGHTGRRVGTARPCQSKMPLRRNTGQPFQRGTRRRTATPFWQCSVISRHLAQVVVASYSVVWVSAPPTALPNAPPIGAPEANVANAIERIVEGGKVWAKMPSYAKHTDVRPCVQVPHARELREKTHASRDGCGSSEALDAA